MTAAEEVRVDRWLWAVRAYPTRTAATEACRAGRVRVGEVAAKPATAVRVGTTVEARVGQRLKVLEVARLVEKRVGAPVAADCFVDRSPPPPPDDPLARTLAFGRERGAGRPTKRDRRDLDRLRRPRRG